MDTRKKLDQVASRAYVQSKSFDDVVEMARNKEKMLAAIPAIQPVANKNLKKNGIRVRLPHTPHL